MASSAGASDTTEKDKVPVEPHADLRKKIEELERLAKESSLGSTCLVHVQDSGALPDNVADRKGSYVFIKDSLKPHAAGTPPIPALFFVHQDGSTPPTEVHALNDWKLLKDILEAGKDKTKRRLNGDQINAAITRVSVEGHSPLGLTKPWTVAEGTQIDYPESEMAKAAGHLQTKLQATMGALASVKLPSTAPGAAAPAAMDELKTVANEYINQLRAELEKVHDLRKGADFLEPGRWLSKKQDIQDLTQQFSDRLNTIDVTAQQTAARNAQQALYNDLNALVPAVISPALQAKYAALLPNASANQRQEVQTELAQLAENHVATNPALRAQIDTANSAIKDYKALDNLTANLRKDLDDVSSANLDEMTKKHAIWLKERLDKQNALLTCMRAQGAMADLEFSRYYGKGMEQGGPQPDLIGVGAYEVRENKYMGKGGSPDELFKSKNGHLFISEYDNDRKVVNFRYIRNEAWHTSNYDNYSVSGSTEIASMQAKLVKEQGYDEVYLTTHDGAGYSAYVGGTFTRQVDLHRASLIGIAMTTQDHSGEVNQTSTSSGPHYLKVEPSQEELKRMFRNSYIIVGEKLFAVNAEGVKRESTITRSELESALSTGISGFLGLVGPYKKTENKELVVKGAGTQETSVLSARLTFDKLKDLQALFMQKDKNMLGENDRVLGFKSYMPINEGIRSMWAKQFSRGCLTADELAKLNSDLSFINSHSMKRALENKKADALISSSTTTATPATAAITTGTAPTSMASPLMTAAASPVPSAPSPPPSPSAPSQSMGTATAFASTLAADLAAADTADKKGEVVHRRVEDLRARQDAVDKTRDQMADILKEIAEVAKASEIARDDKAELEWLTVEAVDGALTLVGAAPSEYGVVGEHKGDDKENLVTSTKKLVEALDAVKEHITNSNHLDRVVSIAALKSDSSDDYMAKLSEAFRQPSASRSFGGP